MSAPSIRTIDPTSPEYARDYRNGWHVGMRATDGALERADDRNVSHAWYDGYHDAAAGRAMWTYRTWRLNGCDDACGYACNGTHRNGTEATPQMNIDQPLTPEQAREAAETMRDVFVRDTHRDSDAHGSAVTIATVQPRAGGSYAACVTGRYVHGWVNLFDLTMGVDQ